MTAALLDRLTFHAHLLKFAGESFRLRQSLKRQAADPAAAEGEGVFGIIRSTRRG